MRILYLIKELSKELFSLLVKGVKWVFKQLDNPSECSDYPVKIGFIDGKRDDNIIDEKFSILNKFIDNLYVKGACVENNVLTYKFNARFKQEQDYQFVLLLRAQVEEVLTKFLRNQNITDCNLKDVIAVRFGDNHLYVGFALNKEGEVVINKFNNKQRIIYKEKKEQPVMSSEKWKDGE